MLRTLASILMLLLIAAPAAFADELTEIIQKDLVALGYDPGNISGEATTPTIVAISKFQAENNLEVTGAASPQLAGIIKSKLKQKNNPAAAVSANSSAGSTDSTMDSVSQNPATLQAAQQACLQKKMADAQASKKKKRGFGSLMRAATRVTSRIGGGGTMQDIARTSGDIYTANATAADLESAAKDLGLTESDLEACRNP